MDRLIPQINVKQLITFYRLIFLCGKYTTIILLYENSTIPILDPILQSMSGYSSIIINIDLDNRYKYEGLYPEEHSLFICALENDVVMKMRQIGVQYDLQTYYSFLFTSRNFNETTLRDKLMNVVEEYYADIVGLILINPNGTFEITRFTCDQPLVVKIPNDPNINCSSYEKMFLKSKFLKGEEYYVFIMLDPPRGINLTSRATDGRQVNTIGGSDAYLASLIESKINITLKLYAYRYSADYNENTNNYKFIKELLEKTYEEDNHTPRQLDYTTILEKDSSNFFKNHSKLAGLQSEYVMQMDYGQLGLYPHEMEKFIFVVPNMVRRKSTLFLSILQMPLMSVWAFAIIIFAVFRKIIRTVMKSKYSEFSSIFFNTFGLSFGTAGESSDTTLVSSSEQLLLWFLSVFAMVASILCSGMFFTEFSTSKLMPSINSLDDLGKNPQLEVYMPNDFDMTTEIWLKQQLRVSA